LNIAQFTRIENIFEATLYVQRFFNLQCKQYIFPTLFLFVLYNFLKFLFTVIGRVSWGFDGLGINFVLRDINCSPPKPLVEAMSNFYWLTPKSWHYGAVSLIHILILTCMGILPQIWGLRRSFGNQEFLEEFWSLVIREHS
jgi:hypothetical protein